MLWQRLSQLPLVVEGVGLERLRARTLLPEPRVSTHVRLWAGETEGVGEDVSPYPEDHDGLQDIGASLPLAGTWTLQEFCDRVAACDMWPRPPAWEPARRFRQWAFESAALDLALRQAGSRLHEVLALEPRPVSFVTSLGLGDPASADRVRDRLERFPGLRLKLDADASWTPALMRELAATGAVTTIDFKGWYGRDVPAAGDLVALYDAVLDRFPGAVLEDPHDHPGVAALLAPHAGRVAYDAPIHTVQDIGRMPIRAGAINVKPCRIGSLRELFAVYAHCASEGISMYGGGMTELGAGRGQIQLLASLFHAGAANDVAPAGYNAVQPSNDLPASPLPADPGAGFRWGG